MIANSHQNYIPLERVQTDRDLEAPTPLTEQQLQALRISVTMHDPPCTPPTSPPPLPQTHTEPPSLPAIPTLIRISRLIQPTVTETPTGQHPLHPPFALTNNIPSYFSLDHDVPTILKERKLHGNLGTRRNPRQRKDPNRKVDFAQIPFMQLPVPHPKSQLRAHPKSQHNT